MPTRSPFTGEAGKGLDVILGAQHQRRALGPRVPGRIIDLTRAAASTLGIVQSGVGRVALFPE